MGHNVRSTNRKDRVMRKPACVYWAHARNTDPSKIFKRKRDAIAWGRAFYDGVFIVEPIVKNKLSERLDYLKKSIGIVPDLAL